MATSETLPLRWPLVQPTLSDGSLTLRPWRPDDEADVLEACQDDEIRRWTPVPVPYLPEHARAYVGEQAPQQWAAQEAALFAAVAPDGGRVLASCGVVRLDHRNLVGEVGYWVAPWARGRRVAQRAGRLVCDWATREGGLERLEFYIEPENHASRAVAERLGAELEGRLRGKCLMRGARLDLMLYAIVA